MKVLSFSRISIVLGLAMGIMVLWAAAAPSVANADSITGGWVAIWCTWTPCDGWAYVKCNEDHPLCNDAWVMACHINPSGSGTCGFAIPYNRPCYGDSECNGAYDTDCPGS